MILACLPFAWALLAPEEGRDFGQSLAAAALSVSNILFWIEEGYFAPAAELKPLLHTWSLGVEEQFYILFPPLLMLLSWRGRFGGARLRAGVIAGLAILSLIAAQALLERQTSFVFYQLPTRA